MKTIVLKEITLRAADPGTVDPLPELRGYSDTYMRRRFELPDDTDLFVDYGRVRHMLPYLQQNGYERALTDRPVKAVILENAFLKAVFLPEYGGRLWQLYDKEHHRELVYHNPVLRFGHLALRNQWFSGGVEWNIGVIGHHAYTCDTVFAGRVRGAHGEDVLRMFLYERIRGVSCQIDAWLLENARQLYVRVRIHNPNRCVTPVYWWSNIAVNASPGGRVIVPAEHMYSYNLCTDVTRRVPLHGNGTDCTRYDTLHDSCDYFFDIPVRSRKYIAHVDAAGEGLLHASTWRLKGRKLFVWGEAPGGKRWQRFLTEGDHPYVEIQAGLAQTQSESLPMPAGATWEWLETYGYLRADPAQALGSNWAAAQKSVCAVMERQHSENRLDAILQESRSAIALRPIEEWYTLGDGWGALEEERRRASGEGPLADNLPFAAGRSAEQDAWRSLLDGKGFPESDPRQPPAPPVAGGDWLQRVLRACETAPDWQAYYQAGLLFWNEGAQEQAVEAWERSVQAQENAWALRNLAVCAKLSGNTEKARRYYRKALALLPRETHLCREYIDFLSEEKEDGALLAFLAQCPDAVQKNSRVRYCEALAYCRTGALDRCEAILTENGGMEIAELRECSEALSDLWFLLQKKKGEDKPLPSCLDFRMFTAAKQAPSKENRNISNI